MIKLRIPPALGADDLGRWLNPVTPSYPSYWVSALVGPSLGYYQRSTPQDRTVFYCFAESLPDYFALESEPSGFEPIPVAQRDAVRNMFRYLETIIDLRFVESTQPQAQATITLMTNRQTGTDGYAWQPGFSLKAYDVFLDNVPPLNFATGSFDALTLIHEVGHALGLRHSFAGTESWDNSQFDASLNGGEESTFWTVMSYTSYKEHFRTELRPFDIAALQAIYGPSKLVRNGNDVYVLDPLGSNFIWDSGGIDTIDASSIDRSLKDTFGDRVDSVKNLRLVLDLNQNTHGYIDNFFDRIILPGQITINAGTVIEHVVGTQSRDWIYGNSANNRLEGRAGDDLLTGRDGADSLWGGEGADSLMGGDGNDWLDGGEGLDWAFFEGKRLDYVINIDPLMITIKHLGSSPNRSTPTGPSATIDIDQLRFVERAQFDDLTVIFPGDPYALWAARLLVLFSGAASLDDRSTAGQVLSLFEQGYTVEMLAQSAIDVLIKPQASLSMVIEHMLGHLMPSKPTDALIEAIALDCEKAGLSPRDIAIIAGGLAITDELIGLSGIQTNGWSVTLPGG